MSYAGYELGKLNGGSDIGGNRCQRYYNILQGRRLMSPIVISRREASVVCPCPIYVGTRSNV